jgi:hypothetical protein
VNSSSYCLDPNILEIGLKLCVQGRIWVSLGLKLCHTAQIWKKLVNTLEATVLILISCSRGYCFDPDILEIGQENCFDNFWVKFNCSNMGHLGLKN